MNEEAMHDEHLGLWDHECACGFVTASKRQNCKKSDEHFSELPCDTSLQL
jgi:hypothetical protein